MEYSNKIIVGLNKPNIGKRMVIFDILSYNFMISILLIGLIIFFCFLPQIIEEIDDTLDYFQLVFLIIILLLELSLTGIPIYLLICSFRARKEVYNYVKDQNHSSLIDCLALHNFQGQHKMKQKDLFKLKYAVAAVGDLQLLNALPNLINILLCKAALSWNIRKWSAYAISKIGTVKAVIVLNKANEIFAHPSDSMFPRPIRPGLISIIIAYSHSTITLIAVRRILRCLAIHNNFSNKNEMIVSLVNSY